ncbi:MAG TPA: IS1380 family transposase [Candidatus Limnocylindrales bacterium]|nr:IS1380 family transposase [Candidatus Limnocylindrales bacterium]
MHDVTGWSKRLVVTAAGKGVVSHAGAVALRLTADRTGLTGALSGALHREEFTPGHDRGRVLADAAVMMADGGNTVRGIDVLRHQADLLGQVASPATLSRTLGELDHPALERVDAARAAVRARVWDLVVARHGRIPPARVPSGDLGDQVVLRIDAHFVDCYSRKEHAGRLRGRYGLHPMAVMCDNTDECLADQLRAGAAGANDADDHIALLTRAIAQIPEPWRRNLLVTADGAGATHKLLNWLTSLGRDAEGQDPGMRVQYSVGWPVDKHTGRAITLLPPEAWTPMLAADGAPGTPATLDAESGPHTVGEAAEITGLLAHLRHWPAGLRVFVRRVKPLRDTTPKPLPGIGQLELDLQTQAAGWRYEAFATNAPATGPGENPHEVTAWLDGRHRVHARVEDHFRVGNDTGADRLPSQRFAVNAAWHRTQAIACDLIAWLRLLGCDDALARAEPATLQHRIFHTPATLTRGGRRRRLNFPPHWPWTGHLHTIFGRLFALPAPT